MTNKECAEQCIIASVVAVLFTGIGFGVTLTSHPAITCKPFAGVIMVAIGLVMILVLRQAVESTGYELRVVIKEGDKASNDN